MRKEGPCPRAFRTPRPSCGHTATPRPGGAYQAHRPRHPDVRSVFVGSVTPLARVRNSVRSVLSGVGCPSRPRPLLPALCLGPSDAPHTGGSRVHPACAARNRSGKWRAEKQSMQDQRLAARFTRWPRVAERKQSADFAVVLSLQKDTLKSDLIICSVAAVLSFAVSASTVFLSLRVRTPSPVLCNAGARGGSLGTHRVVGPRTKTRPRRCEAHRPEGGGCVAPSAGLGSCTLPLPVGAVWLARVTAHFGGSTVQMAGGHVEKGEATPQPESHRWAEAAEHSFNQEPDVEGPRWAARLGVLADSASPVWNTVCLRTPWGREDPLEKAVGVASAFRRESSPVGGVSGLDRTHPCPCPVGTWGRDSHTCRWTPELAVTGAPSPRSLSSASCSPCWPAPWAS